MSKTYYVRTDGNNFNPGTGYTTALAYQTVAKAVSVVASGDTIYIAPQTFYESVTLATNGTSASGGTISWIGDKESNYFIDLKPGACRITGCNALTGVGEGLNIVNFNSKTYNTFRNLVIDGTTFGTRYGTTAHGIGTVFYDCIVSGSYAGINGNSVSNITVIRCSVYGGQTGINSSTVHNSYVMGGTYGIATSIAYNTIASGGFYSFYTMTTAINCMSYSGVYGFYVGTNHTNCVAFGNQYGFAGTNTMILIKCKAINCTTAFYGTSTGVNRLNVADCKYASCNVATRGGSTYDVGTPTEAKYEGYNDIGKLLKISQAMKFNINEQNWSSDLNVYKFEGFNVSSPASANTFYDAVGTYNSENLYQSINNDFLLFNTSAMTGLTGTNWVIQANLTQTPNLYNVNFAYRENTILGNYNNFGNWAFDYRGWGGTGYCQTNSATVFTENYDILGAPRRMGSGNTLDAGAYEYSNVDLEWSNYRTYAPAIKISQSGQKRITITGKKGLDINLSCWVYFVNGGTLNKPQIVISSYEDTLTTNPRTLSAVGAESTWEEITATITPKADGIIFINLYNVDSQNSSYCIFSDLSF